MAAFQQRYERYGIPADESLTIDDFRYRDARGRTSSPAHELYYNRIADYRDVGAAVNWALLEKVRMNSLRAPASMIRRERH